MRQQQSLPSRTPGAAKPVTAGLLQRKCACGNHTVAGGTCAECAKPGKSRDTESGNGALQWQKKLRIGASNDPLEQAADQVAERVVSAPMGAALATGPQQIQRFTPHAGERTQPAPASVEHVLAGSGSALEPTLRHDMEQRFGYDFSRVRVHSGATAEQSAKDVNAHAYTVGHNVVFGSGQYAPATQAGRRLIAHELTHVVQQAGPGGLRGGQGGAGSGQSPMSFQLGSTSTGTALDPPVRRDMERSFGHDFSQVKVHIDGDADRLARRENALAFTTGKDIYFRQGAYASQSKSGRWLLAHELAHVVQQSHDGNSKQTFGERNGQAVDALEHEADIGASRVLSGQAVDMKLRSKKRLLAFPMCRSILDASEGEVIPESAVQRDLATRLAASGPVERELPIPAASFAPYRTTDRRRPNQVDPNVFDRPGRAGDGSADLALLIGQRLEVAEVKRADWQQITEAERQLENYVQKGQENLPFIQQRWGQRRGGTPTITSVRAMPANRLNIPSPIRLGSSNVPTSVSWCRDGVISFKAIGGQDANIFVCGSPARSSDRFIDSLISRAELMVDQVVDGRVVPAIDTAIQSTSTRQALERLRADPAFNGLLQNMLGPASPLIDLLDGAGPMLDQLDSLIHGQTDRLVRIAIKTMKDQVIVEIRRTVKQQVRRALQDALNALCVAAAQVTAEEALRELRRRMNQLMAQAIPVAVVAVLGAVLAQMLGAVGEALLEALKYIAIGVGVVVAAIALWEVAAAIAAGAALAEVGTAIAAFFSQLARLLWPLVFA